MTPLAIGMLFLLSGVAPASADQAMQIGTAKAAVAGEEPLEVVVRAFEPASVVQMDVVRGDQSVVSFVAGTGFGGRAICEGVFVNEGAWFAWCSVFDFPFSNVTEFTNSRALADSGFTRLTYALGASTGMCTAELILAEPRIKDLDAIGEDLVLLAVREMSTWTDSQVNGLVESLSMIGHHGCPVLGRALAGHFGSDRSLWLTTGDMEEVSTLPDRLSAALDHVRKPGLGGWLNEIASDLP